MADSSVPACAGGDSEAPQGTFLHCLVHQISIHLVQIQQIYLHRSSKTKAFQRDDFLGSA